MKKYDNNRESKAGQDHYKHRAFMWFSLVAFILRDAFVSFGRGVLKIFVPPAGESQEVSGQKISSRVSTGLHTVFAVITLEGPRLMLISRYRAARMKRGTKVGLSAAGGTAIASIVVASILIGSQLIAVTVDGKVIGYVEDEGQYSTLLQRAKEKVSAQVGIQNTEILIDETKVTQEAVIAPQQQTMIPAEDVTPAKPIVPEDGDNVDHATVGSDPAAGGDAPLVADKDNAALAPLTTTVSPATGGAVDTLTAVGDAPVDGGAEAADVSDTGETSVDAVTSGDASEEQAGEEALVDLLINSLVDDGAITATAYTITVDGKEMATLGSLKEASDVLNAIRDRFIPEGTPESDVAGRFLEDVTTNSITTELDKIGSQNPEDVVDYLLTGTADSRSYTAVADDTIENVCASLGINESKLREEYPEYNFTKITEGDVFSTTLNIPYVNYQTEGAEVTNEPLPFETIEEKTDTLFLGQREIKEEGVLGERKVTRFVKRINGEIVDTTEVGSEILKEPVAETMLVGTKMVFMGEGSSYVGPSDGYGGGGNGTLGRPLNSWYLSRSVGNGHNGADMLAPQGTPIFAADTGTVTFVGVWGGYGNLVIVDHRNGMQTYYAHCDSFNTTEGAEVQRGQQIATVGSTGRSTAFHLHFEVRINGAVQEPLDWIG